VPKATAAGHKDLLAAPVLQRHHSFIQRRNIGSALASEFFNIAFIECIIFILSVTWLARHQNKYAATDCMASLLKVSLKRREAHVHGAYRSC
jgi:hypothetical protein